MVRRPLVIQLHLIISAPVINPNKLIAAPSWTTVVASVLRFDIPSLSGVSGQFFTSLQEECHLVLESLGIASYTYALELVKLSLYGVNSLTCE